MNLAQTFVFEFHKLGNALNSTGTFTQKQEQIKQ